MTQRTTCRLRSLAPGARLVLGAAALAAFACAGKKTPEPMPSQTTTQVTPQLEPPPANLPPPIRQLPTTKPQTVKVIDPGGDAGPDNLVEASNLARKRKQAMPPPIADINDENLRQHAEGGRVIILAETPAAPPVTSPTASSSPAAASTSPAPQNAEAPDDPASGATDLERQAEAADAVPAGSRGESYWRNRALELRMGWRRTIDELSNLELEAAALRQQFYAEEDVYVRDNQIKPTWDRVLDRLERLRDRSAQIEKDLDRFIGEGRLGDVPQGWLNEGWELEPTPEERSALAKVGIHEPEPTTIAEPAKDIE